MTKNQGVHTNDGQRNNIREEVRSVIELMGPSTPHEKENEDSSVSIIEILSEDKEIIQNMVQQVDAKPMSIPNTPRDYSELSSLVTDTTLEPSQQNDASEQLRRHFQPIKKLSNLLRFKPSLNHGSQLNNQQNNVDLYRINICQPKAEAAPRRVIFDLVKEPHNCTNVATNTTPRGRRKSRREAQVLYRNANCVNDAEIGRQYDQPIIDTSIRMQKKTIYKTTSGNKVPGRVDCLTRVDVYYFDHGNSAYYHTTDCPPVIMTEILAEKTETYTTKFWAETFGFLHVLFSFLTSFVLQLLRSILQGLVRPLTIGLLQIVADYCFKPLLATIFNALVQPPLIFFYNVATSLRDICDPVAEGLGFFIREIATLFASLRLVEIHGECKDGGTRHERKRKQDDVESNANLTVN